MEIRQIIIGQLKLLLYSSQDAIDPVNRISNLFVPFLLLICTMGKLLFDHANLLLKFCSVLLILAFQYFKHVKDLVEFVVNALFVITLLGVFTDYVD